MRAVAERPRLDAAPQRLRRAAGLAGDALRAVGGEHQARVLRDDDERRGGTDARVSDGREGRARRKDLGGGRSWRSFASAGAPLCIDTACIARAPQRRPWRLHRAPPRVRHLRQSRDSRGEGGTTVSVVPRRSGSRVAGAGFLRLPPRIRLPYTYRSAFCSRSARGVEPTTSPSSREVAPRARRVLPTGSAPVASGRVRGAGGRRTSPSGRLIFFLRQSKMKTERIII